MCFIKHILIYIINGEKRKNLLHIDYFQGSSALALQGTLASATQQPNKNCTKRLATGSSGAVLSTDRDSNWVIIFSVSSTYPGQSVRPSIALSDFHSHKAKAGHAKKKKKKEYPIW